MHTETIEPENITLENVLEHPALFGKEKLLNLLTDRFKAVQWVRTGTRARNIIYMMYEIDAISEKLWIKNYSFNKDRSELKILTSQGELKFY